MATPLWAVWKFATDAGSVRQQARRRTVHTLGLEAHRKVSLDAEVTLALHFLAIEQVRFGERLVVKRDVAIDALACLLPPRCAFMPRAPARSCGSRWKMTSMPPAIHWSRSANRFRGELTIPFETKGETKGASACG